MAVVLDKPIKAAVGTLTFGPFAIPALETHIGVFIRAQRWPAQGTDLMRVTLRLEDGDALEEHTVTTDGENPETPGEWHLVLDMGEVADRAHPRGRRRVTTHLRHRLTVVVEFLRELRCEIKIGTERQA